MTAAIMIQLITGAIGSVGFGILFHIKKKYLPLAAVGGFLSWLVFLLGKEFWGNVLCKKCTFVKGSSDTNSDYHWRTWVGACGLYYFKDEILDSL